MPVRYPLLLDMRPYTSVRLHASQVTTYRLYAVVEHDATDGTRLSGGHYTAKVRADYGGSFPINGVTDGSWWEANDSRVTPVRDEDVMAPTAAYLLFYERVAQ